MGRIFFMGTRHLLSSTAITRSVIHLSNTSFLTVCGIIKSHGKIVLAQEVTWICRSRGKCRISTSWNWWPRLFFNPHSQPPTGFGLYLSNWVASSFLQVQNMWLFYFESIIPEAHGKPHQHQDEVNNQWSGPPLLSQVFWCSGPPAERSPPLISGDGENSLLEVSCRKVGWKLPQGATIC